MYHSVNIFVEAGPVFDWCDLTAHKANNLYNAGLFRIRQCMTSRRKESDDLSDNEREVLSEIDQMNKVLMLNNKKPRDIPNSGCLLYTFLDDLMKYWQP